MDDATEQAMAEYLARGGTITREEDFLREQKATRRGITGQKPSHIHRWKWLEPGKYRCVDCDSFGHRISTTNWHGHISTQVFEEKCHHPKCNGWGTGFHKIEGHRRPRAFCPKHTPKD